MGQERFDKLKTYKELKRNSQSTVPEKIFSQKVNSSLSSSSAKNKIHANTAKSKVT